MTLQPDHISKAGKLFGFAGRNLDLSVPVVMGILNVTPDSFSDGGELFSGSSGSVAVDKVLKRAGQMVADGASILDVGGESTRPGAKAVSETEEMDRVLPVLAALSNEYDVVLSIDTSSPAVMRSAVEVGAGLINDVRALGREGALQAVAESGLPVCLMHMQGQPDSMQNAPAYSALQTEILTFLTERVKACEQAGIARSKIILDPGFGFGKTLDHNLELLGRLDAFMKLELPVLIGISRKRMIGEITGKTAKQRMAGSLAAHLLGVQKGARIIRTHDVAETVDALKVWSACQPYLTEA